MGCPTLFLTLFWRERQDLVFFCCTDIKFLRLLMILEMPKEAIENRFIVATDEHLRLR